MTQSRYRLGVIVLGVTGALLLGGCARQPDPRLDVTASTYARSDLWLHAATAEAALSQAYLVALTTNLIPQCQDWCPAAAAMHTAHATVLAQPDPWGGFVAPAPAPTPAGASYADATAAIQDLQQAAQNALSADQAGLTSASPGPEALLWASLVATAQVSVAWATDPSIQRPAPIAGSVVPSHVDVGSTVDAAAKALDTVNTLIYALTTASAQASTSQDLRQQLARRLGNAARQRDNLQTVIVAAGATPSPPALSYLLPDGVASDDAVRATWGALELTLATDYVRLSSTMTTGDAPGTVAQADFATATALGQTLTWWPGWG